MEYLDAHPQRLSESLGSDRDDHELLTVHTIGGVGASIQNVHHRHWHHPRERAPEIPIERKPDRHGGRPSATGQRHPPSIAFAPRLALFAVPSRSTSSRVDSELIPSTACPYEGTARSSLRSARTAPRTPLPPYRALSPSRQLDGLVLAGAGAAGDRRATHRSVVEDNVCLDRGVPTAIEDFASVYFGRSSAWSGRNVARVERSDTAVDGATHRATNLSTAVGRGRTLDAVLPVLEHDQPCGPQTSSISAPRSR